MADNDGPDGADRGEFANFASFAAGYEACMACWRSAAKSFNTDGSEAFDTNCQFGAALSRCEACASKKKNAVCVPAAGLMAGDIRDLHLAVEWYNEVVLETVPAPANDDNDGGGGDNDDDDDDDDADDDSDDNDDGGVLVISSDDEDPSDEDSEDDGDDGGAAAAYAPPANMVVTPIPPPVIPAPRPAKTPAKRPASSQRVTRASAKRPRVANMDGPGDDPFEDSSDDGLALRGGDGSDDGDREWAYSAPVREAAAIGLRTLVFAVEHIEKQHRARFGLTGRQDADSFRKYAAQVERRRESMRQEIPRAPGITLQQYRVETLPRLLNGDHHFSALEIARLAFVADVTHLVSRALGPAAAAVFQRGLPESYLA